MPAIRSRGTKSRPKKEPWDKKPARPSAKSGVAPAKHYLGKYPELLDILGRDLLRIGVDFGTGNFSAAWIVVNKKGSENLAYVKRVNILRTQNHSIRFPTVVALKPSEDDPTQATLLFADIATKALSDGYIKHSHVIHCPKLGLIDSDDGIFEADRKRIADLKAAHQDTFKLAATFRSIKVQYPGSSALVEVSFKSPADAIVQCLKYFLALVKKNISNELELNPDQVDQVFKTNTEVNFAAPTFWKDSMLDRFLRLLEEAEWPTRARIWSEPKTALSAYITLDFADRKDKDDTAVRARLLDDVFVVIDIGDGSLDTTTTRPVEVTGDTIKLATVAESGGSLCGGRLINQNIQNKIELICGPSMQAIRRSVTTCGAVVLSTQDFLQGFLYDRARETFIDDKSTTTVNVRYDGNSLPAQQFPRLMTSRAVKLSMKEMKDAHDEYLIRVLGHIDEQIARTKSTIDVSKARIKVVLVGGVTQAPYIVEKIEEHLSGEDIIVINAEQPEKPLVAIGAILCAGQPSMGRRFKSKEAYGIPIAEKWQKSKHGISNRFAKGRADKGVEARDLTDWIVQLGYSTDQKYVEEYDWDWELEDDDGRPRKNSPRQDPNFTLEMEQQILSTTHPVYGVTQRLEYKTVPEVDQRKFLRIPLSKEQCDTIDRKTSCQDKGFFQDPNTGAWHFSTNVRIIVDWPDVRTRWQVEVPETGTFEKSADGTRPQLWKQEITLVCINNHGVREGDDLLNHMDTNE